MFDPNKLSDNKLFQALVELDRVDRRGILTVDVTEIFVKDLSGQPYETIVRKLCELGINRPPNAVPAAGKEGWIIFDYAILRRVPNNKFKPLDRVAIGFSLSADNRVNVTSAAWLNTAAYP